MTVKICVCGSQYDDMGFKTVCPKCFEKTRQGKVSPQFLGMCMNQAIQLIIEELKTHNNQIGVYEFEKHYKERVRQLFKWNTELGKELVK